MFLQASVLQLTKSKMKRIMKLFIDRNHTPKFISNLKSINSDEKDIFKFNLRVCDDF